MTVVRAQFTRWTCKVPGCAFPRLRGTSFCFPCTRRLQIRELQKLKAPSPPPKKPREPWTPKERTTLVTAVIEFMMAIEGIPLPTRAVKPLAKLRAALNYAEGDADY